MPMTGATAGPAQAGLTVVIPCFNEQDNVEPVYAEIVTELTGYELELLFVDDGSTDRTLNAIKRLARADPRVQYVSFTRNFGFEAAFSAGYRYARHPWVLHIDADQQFPAAEAGKMIKVATGGGYDAVFGVRTNRKDPLVRRWGTAAFHFIAGRLLRIELPSGATAFRLVRTELARTIVDLGLPTPYFLATVPRLTSRYTTVLVAHRARLRGEPKVRLGWLAAHAIELFVGFTRRPAHAAAVAGLVAAGFSALLGLATALGLIGGAAASATLFVLVAVSLAVCSMTLRLLIFVAAGQARPRLFYVREASVPIDKRDLLFSDETQVGSVHGKEAG
jgi:glycosyltransferase involved in cell wall biosynthesis